MGFVAGRELEQFNREDRAAAHLARRIGKSDHYSSRRLHLTSSQPEQVLTAHSGAFREF
jgi:hypothetical protein